MATDVTLLAEVPLFQLLDNEERATLAGLLDVRNFSKGETIFTYGDAGDALFIVRRGSVQVFVEDCTGETIILSENLPGDVFGEISLLDGGPRTATAVATDETEALVMNRGDLLDLITKHPHAAMDLLSVMGRRLR